MTKSELVEKVSSRVTAFSRRDIEVIVDTLFQSMADNLAKGGKVEIRGFGSFKIKERDGRRGRNPKSGESIYVQPKRVPFFKAGKEIRERINPGSVDDESE
ncbi:MAG: integration host factor subunit beta [Deltaproteobacteria bacterium RIFCSPLOWO2_02_FULL_53_8]|nr:MAG: integration host factor subunit beta [Deltaproteobacteria bacterium RIFCSPLOWO2_02_FULL_53_8]